MTTQRMLSPFRKALTQFKMLKDGDKVAVGVSGGKDSVTLLKLFCEYKKFAPEKFELVAISIDLQFDGKPTDFSLIRKMCEEYGVEYYVEKTDIGQIVFEERKEKNPCSLCSKMRKGALYNLASKLGCNKVALGHHSDDMVDTMLLSFFYEGRLSTFAPKSYLSKTDITMIRPLIFIREANIKSYAKILPITKSCCPANGNTKREYVKNLVEQISKDIPNVREIMFTALLHSERYNLFNKFNEEIDKIL